MLSLLRALSSPGRAQNKCPAQAFSQRSSSLGPSKGTLCLLQTCQERQENKAHYPGPWYVQSPKQEPQNLWCRETAALLCCSQPGLWCQEQPWAGVMGITKPIKESDHMTMGHCKDEELLIPLCLTGVTYTLGLWHWHINFIFQLTAQAAKSNGFIQFTIKQRSKPVHREQALLDIDSIWRSKRGVFNFALF